MEALARQTPVKKTEKPPTIPYPGAKGRMASTLVSFMPESGGLYVEPFAGRGNVFFAAAQRLSFASWQLNDIATAPFFLALQEHGGRVKVPERSREEYDRQKSRHKVGDPRAILLEPYLTFSGGGYSKGGYGGARSATSTGYTNTLRKCNAILKSTSATVTSLDWREMGLESLTSDDFVFLDPPYYGADVRAYTSVGFDHEKLVATLQKARFRWLLTEYKQPLYTKKLGRPFYEREVQLACSRLGTSLGTRSRVECCWRNY